MATAAVLLMNIESAPQTTSSRATDLPHEPPATRLMRCPICATSPLSVTASERIIMNSTVMTAVSEKPEMPSARFTWPVARRAARIVSAMTSTASHSKAEAASMKTRRARTMVDGMGYRGGRV